MALSSRPPQSPPAKASARRAVERELEAEDQRVLYPLTQRIAAIADRLSDGDRVDPDYVAEAIALWDRYVNDLHAQRIQHLIRPFPAATTPGPGPAVRPARRRERSGPEPPEESAVDQFREIHGDLERMTERMAVLHGLLETYREGRAESRELLASLLRSASVADRAWARYEEEFALRFLDERLAANVEQQVRAALQATAPLRDALAAAVDAFLARPIPILPPAPPAAPTPAAGRPPPAGRA